jgi:hypothetical protein
MIGACATCVVQDLFRQYAPGAFDYCHANAVAFDQRTRRRCSGRTVIRHLYGRR